MDCVAPTNGYINFFCVCVCVCLVLFVSKGTRWRQTFVFFCRSLRRSVWFFLLFLLISRRCRCHCHRWLHRCCWSSSISLYVSFFFFCLLFLLLLVFKFICYMSLYIFSLFFFFLFCSRYPKYTNLIVRFWSICILIGLQSVRLRRIKQYHVCVIYNSWELNSHDKSFIVSIHTLLLRLLRVCMCASVSA